MPSSKIAAIILKTAQIRNFKSIIGLTEFTLDERATCLVVKNESRKDAILRFIGKLNSTEADSEEFDIFEYSCRYMTEYQQRAEPEPAEALIPLGLYAP